SSGSRDRGADLQRRAARRQGAAGADRQAQDGGRSFFFQAEDGIRDGHVTGVQTCALPISSPAWSSSKTGSRSWIVKCGSDHEEGDEKSTSRTSSRLLAAGTCQALAERLTAHPKPCRPSGSNRAVPCPRSPRPFGSEPRHCI